MPRAPRSTAGSPGLAPTGVSAGVPGAVGRRVGGVGRAAVCAAVGGMKSAMLAAIRAIPSKVVFFIRGYG